MSAGWFIHDSRGQHGPFNDPELHARLRGYAELDDVHVWRDGLEGWQPAKTFLRQSAAPVKLPRVKARWTLYGLGFGVVIAVLASVFSSGPLVRYIDWSTKSIAENAIVLAIGVASAAFWFFLIGLIADIFSRTKKAKGDVVPHSALDDLASPDHHTKHRFNNFIARNWRGEYPLWVSYWLVGIGTNIVAVAIPLLLALLIRPENGFWPLANFAFFAALWLRSRSRWFGNLSASGVPQMCGSRNVLRLARGHLGRGWRNLSSSSLFCKT